jgi:hypothetical protein
MKNELPKDKAQRIISEKRIKLIFSDVYEARYSVNKTEVAFLNKKKEYRCFNAQCSLFRGDKKQPSCYHTFAVEILRGKDDADSLTRLKGLPHPPTEQK